MSSRIVQSWNNSKEYICKSIPSHKALKEIHFPTLDEYADSFLNLDLLKIKDIALRDAIQQQYTEWHNWYISSEEIRCFLAPIVNTFYDENNLPVLCFPRFIPLMADDEVTSFTQNEMFAIMGMRLKELEIREKEFIGFSREIRNICDWLELREEDIIYNPSNIGYNKIFGLRIIDYGLK